MLFTMAICMTLIILVGPFLRAVGDRDYYEMVIDVILISFFWAVYYLISLANWDLVGLINRALD